MKIKVILTDNIKGVGKKDDIIEVKEGYANNFLLSKNKAILATDENIKKLENKKNKQAKNIEKEIELAQNLKKQIEESSIKLYVKGGKDGKIYGSLGNKEIELALKNQLKINLDKKKLANDIKLKSLGTHTVEIKLYQNIKANLKIEVLDR